MKQPHKPVNLDVFSDVAGCVILNGAEHNVLHLNGEEFRVLSGAYSVLDVYPIVERIVPTLGAEAAWKLTAERVGNIIAIADGRVADVESQFPNGTGPATTEPQSSPSPA